VGELLRDTDWIVTRVDSDTGVTDLDPKKKNIVIGTELALRSVLWDNISLVIHVDPDKSLQTPEMNADERLWHTLWSIVHRTHLWTKILLQTFSREHILYRSLQTPELFYRTTLEARHALDFPPYSYLVRYIYADDTPQKAQSISEKMYTHLTRETEAMGIVCKISTPAPTHPAYHRRKYCFVIIIRFDITTKLNTIAKLNSYFGHGWKIDPRPNTLQMI
jgi:primosomal protein N' (replication factor Y) (superfamily II helicase)